MTFRRRIVELLKERSYSIRELALLIGAEMKEITEDIKHIKKSVLPKHRLIVEYSVCRNCGFKFKEREKFKTPTKCPRCRSESITEMRFRVK